MRSTKYEISINKLLLLFIAVLIMGMTIAVRAEAQSYWSQGWSFSPFTVTSYSFPTYPWQTNYQSWGQYPNYSFNLYVPQYPNLYSSPQFSLTSWYPQTFQLTFSGYGGLPSYYPYYQAISLPAGPADTLAPGPEPVATTDVPPLPFMVKEYADLPASRPQDDEEYAVYSALISSEMFLDRFYGTTPNKIQIRNHTNVLDSKPTNGFINSFSQSMEGLARETVLDYFTENDREYPLDYRLNLPFNYELVGDEVVYGPFLLSRVGFNSQRDQALVSVGKNNAPVEGIGYHFFLVKVNGVWTCQDMTVAWVA